MLRDVLGCFGTNVDLHPPVTLEVTPNVSGQIIAIPVKPNLPVKAGRCCSKSIRLLTRSRSVSLKRRWPMPRQQVKQLSASFVQASASVDGLTKQLAFQEQRLEDIRRLSSSRSVAEFREQDAQAQYDTVHYQLVAAKAAQENARLAMESEVGGEPLLKQKRSWSRRSGSSSRLPSPDDGYVSSMAAAPGAGALVARSVMSFIIGDEIAIVGMFQPNGFPV